MASSVPLSRSIAVAQNFVRNAPLTFPASNDPAFSNADWVRQFILAPPFAWSWNRTDESITCVVGQQDYTIAIPQFGWLEKAVMLDPDGGENKELQIVLDLAEENIANQPNFISTQTEDGAGNVTFRITPSPDKVYTIHVITQGSAGLFASTADTWAPIPDRLRFLYETGFLAKSYEYLDDSRFGPTMSLFLRQVIAANAALTESQVNLFLDSAINTQRETSAAAANSQLGRQGRGAF